MRCVESAEADMGAGPLYSGRGRRRVLRATSQAVGGRISPLTGSQSRLGGRYEQCVQSLSDACVYMQRAAQRHAEALHALDRLEAGGSAGVVVVEPPVRFVPAADRAKQREKAIREAEMDQVAAAAGERAVLAELRAIGLCIGGPAVRTQLCL